MDVEAFFTPCCACWSLGFQEFVTVYWKFPELHLSGFCDYKCQNPSKFKVFTMVPGNLEFGGCCNFVESMKLC